MNQISPNTTQPWAQLFKMETLSSLGIGLLVFFVLSSKHIILYNEETLVVLCFIGFILTCQKMLGESIENSLNSRSELIATELVNSLVLKEQLIQELMKEHEKQNLLSHHIQSLGELSLSEISHIGAQRQNALQTLCMNQINQKLKSLAQLGSEGPVASKLQHSISLSFRGAVLEEFQRSKKNLKSKLIADAVSTLKKTQA